MGIPSYFSHIIKNYPTILKQFEKLNKKYHNLYLDSNSIIYDCLRDIIEKLKKDNSPSYQYNEETFEKELISNVCQKIDDYVDFIQPTNKVFIAFDGVAPVAKLEQQRTRRYKSYIEKNMFNNPEKDENDITSKILWDKTAITPGTGFMKKLGTTLKEYYNNPNYIISSSLEEGEGEHKIFQYIRDNNETHKYQNTVIYGLDADLIILCLNHIPITNKLYLYRETPVYIRSLHDSVNPEYNYLMDIHELANTITLMMNNYKQPNTKQQKNRLYDYILLSFFLGNDFMPHFPSVNIRTNGPDIMMEAYQKTVGNTNNNLTDGKKIYWKNLRKMVEYLAENEYQNLMSEYNIRNKWEKRPLRSKTKEDKWLHTPTKNRENEKYINPRKPHWQYRYYDILFHTNNSKQQISINYLEGLEWTMKYYTTSCPDWRWHYKYNYPPLFNDLLTYIPYFDTTMMEFKEKNPVTPYVQLAYVLPKSLLYLLPEAIKKDLLKQVPYYYDDDYQLEWSFCKYIWECHVDFPPIDIEVLENIVNDR